MAFHTFAPPILQLSLPVHVFAAISRALVSNGFFGSPGTVQKRHASFPVSAS